tara:strand:+ start:27915 stop:29285 length:1371 start_codon:yes stop_codon:yes gene_type:complete
MYKIKIAGALAAVTLLLSLPSAANAERDGEFGAFAGIHIFNDDNELGVVDDTNADSLSNNVTFGIRAAYALTGMLDLEGELAIVPTDARDAGTDVVQFGWRGHALFHFMDGSFRPFALAGVGGSTASSEDERQVASDTDFVFHGGLGAKYDIQDNWGVRFDARLILPPSSANDSLTTDTEFLLGLYKTFGDTPDPEKKEAVAVASDDDGDGIPNDADACPTEAEDMDGFKDDDGCPELDNDEDGVPDASDECPDLPEDKDGFKDEDGCAETDNDEDGILDTADQCPMEAEDRDGFMDEDGCPELDNDEDGVADADDTCPTEKETANGYQDSDGCADAIPEKLKKFSGAIKGIRFQTGKSKIRPSSFTVLNKAVKVFAEFAELRVEVQGHTDNTGSAEVNTKLSQDRAQAVVDYLVKKGIAADRLEAKGFGPSEPKADNATKAGQEENRRVEFKLIN